jgi:hypothetical protein
MNWKGCGRKKALSNLRYYTRIFSEGLRKITKNLSQVGALVKIQTGHFLNSS